MEMLSTSTLACFALNVPEKGERTYTHPLLVSRSEKVETPPTPQKNVYACVHQTGSREHRRHFVVFTDKTHYPPPPPSLATPISQIHNWPSIMPEFICMVPAEVFTRCLCVSLTWLGRRSANLLARSSGCSHAIAGIQEKLRNRRFWLNQLISELTESFWCWIYITEKLVGVFHRYMRYILYILLGKMPQKTFRKESSPNKKTWLVIAWTFCMPYSKQAN